METIEQKVDPAPEEPLTAAQARMVLILAEIEQLQQELHNKSTRNDEIHRLRQEYNRMVEEEADGRRQTSRDPLEVLPPELWKDILPENVDEALILTLVSTRWREALTSIPFLWTDISLDGTEGDYYAKAITCIHLSRPLEIDLRIDVPLKRWKEIAPQFTAESDRIRSLEILYPRETRLDESLEIFTSFKDLPVLRNAKLPFRSWYSIYGYDPFAYPNSTVFEGIPSLVGIRSLPFTLDMLKTPTFSNIETANVRYFNREMAEALTQLRNLKCVLLSQGHLPESIPTVPTSMQGCLTSVTKFCYWGHAGIRYLSPENALALDHALMSMGQNLVQIFAGPVNIYSLPDLLASLQRFPNLSDLQFDVDHEREIHRTVSSETYKICLPAIRKLNLFFRTPTLYDTSQTEGQLQEDRNVQENAFSRLFRSLISMAPTVEELFIQGDCMAKFALEYTQTLHSLHSLTISPYVKRFADPSFHVCGDETEKQTWSRYVPPVEFLDQVSHQSLKFLQMSTATPPPHFSPVLDEALGGFRVQCPRYNISSTVMPSLTTLSLQVDHPLLLDLTNISNLKTLTLIGHPCATLASDFFEELLLQPNQWPSLESIIIRGDFMEWDILVLMLERRNFVAKPRVKRINAVQFDGDLPYKLVYPISQLLKGNFPETSPLMDISIEEIGTRLSNPKL
jgi:hypothetical protein